MMGMQAWGECACDADGARMGRAQPRFADRREAGWALAQALLARGYGERVVVLALPNGGTLVGAEVARLLGAPLDLMMVHPFGMPSDRERRIATVVDGPLPLIVFDDVAMRHAGVDRAHVADQALIELRETGRWRQRHLGDRAALPVAGCTVIVVDDGAATGATVRAAVAGLRARRAGRVVIALPVAPGPVLERLRDEADEVVCLAQPLPFRSVAAQYDDPSAVTDAMVELALADVDAARR